MEMSALFTLNELDRTIGDFRVGLAVQRHPDRKTARGVFSNDLDRAAIDDRRKAAID